MYLRYWKMRDEGDGGGSEGGSGSQADQRGSEGGSGGKVDWSNPKAAETAFNELKTQHGELSSKFDDLTGKYENLTKKAGDQGNKAGLYNKLEEAFAKNPEAAIEALAEQYGVSRGTKNKLDIKTMMDLAENNPDELKSRLAEASAGQSEEKFLKMIRQELSPVKKTMFEQVMASKFQDWDSLAPERESLLNKVSSGEMAPEQLAHMAVQAGKIKEIQEAAFKKGAEAKEAELAEKMQGQVGGGGGYKQPSAEQQDKNKKALQAAILHVNTARG